MGGSLSEEQPLTDAVDPERAQKQSRVRRSVESIKLRTAAAREDLERRRATVPVIDVAFRAAEHDSRTGGGILAGAVAFRFFLFVVPYVFVVVFALGFGATAADENPVDVARRSGIVGLAATAIEASTELSTFARVVTLSVALWALVIGSRTMVKSIYTVHSLIWGVRLVKPRRLTVKALVTIVGLTGLLAVVRIADVLRDRSLTLWIVATVLMVVVPGSAWLWCTTKVLLSESGTTWKDMLPGAAFLGVGVQLLHVVTVVWIAHSLESKSDTYGALGAALTILLWAYLLGRLVTGSTSLNTVIWRNKVACGVSTLPS